MLLSTPIAYYGGIIGNGFQSDFDRPKSILNIKWFNWLWILPFLLGQVISVYTALIFSLWAYGDWSGNIVSLFFDFGDFIGRLILGFISGALLLAIIYLHSLLTEDDNDIKFKWLQILGLVFLFWVAYALLINLNQLGVAQ